VATATATHLRRSERQLAPAPRHLARTLLGAKHRDTARMKVARVHATMADQRAEGLHQRTTRLRREHPTIGSEALAVTHLGRTHALAGPGDP